MFHIFNIDIRERRSKLLTLFNSDSRKPFLDIVKTAMILLSTDIDIAYCAVSSNSKTVIDLVQTVV